MPENKQLIPVKQDDVDRVAALHPKVTERQRQLVETLLHEGLSITAAAERIGANRSWASTTLSKQHVKDYAVELAGTVMGSHALRALATMGDLLTAKSQFVRLEAARDLMDRAGMRAPDTSGPVRKVTVSFEL